MGYFFVTHFLFCHSFLAGHGGSIIGSYYYNILGLKKDGHNCLQKRLGCRVRGAQRYCTSTSPFTKRALSQNEPFHKTSPFTKLALSQNEPFYKTSPFTKRALSQNEPFLQGSYYNIISHVFLYKISHQCHTFSRQFDKHQPTDNEPILFPCNKTIDTCLF